MPDNDTPERDALRTGAAAIDALVERWFFESFHGSPVARATDVWNVVHDAKEELKRRLASLLADA